MLDDAHRRGDARVNGAERRRDRAGARHDANRKGAAAVLEAHLQKAELEFELPGARDDGRRGRDVHDLGRARHWLAIVVDEVDNQRHLVADFRVVLAVDQMHGDFKGVIDERVGRRARLDAQSVLREGVMRWWW